MARQIEISPEKIREALQSKPVREGLAAAAQQIMAAGQRIAESEEIEGDFAIEEGIRPKGRPYARVTFSNADQEHGTSKTKRSRVLGRAGEEVLPGEVS